jgi:hypothetical protein
MISEYHHLTRVMILGVQMQESSSREHYYPITLSPDAYLDKLFISKTLARIY